MSGPKTVMCCICNQTVTKKQTLDTGKGRACRSHPGVEDLAKIAQDALDLQQQKGRTKPKKDWMNSGIQETEFSLDPKCFNCKCKGMHAQDWYIRVLVCNEKYQLTYGKPLNPFDAVEGKKAYAELMGFVPLYTKEFKPGMKVHWNGRQFGQIFGFVMLCPNCCQINNIDPLAHMKNITLEQLSYFSAVVESQIRPSFVKQAQNEIQSKN